MGEVVPFGKVASLIPSSRPSRELESLGTRLIKTKIKYV